MEIQPTVNNGVHSNEQETPRASMFSSVTGRRIEKSDIDAKYWARNMTSPVRFIDAVRTMYTENKPTMIVEISPKSTLRGLVLDILSRVRTQPICVSIMTNGPPPTKTALEVVGKCWSMGMAVKMTSVMDA
jgi:acyl transferase domain-containing protein